MVIATSSETTCVEQFSSELTSYSLLSTVEDFSLLITILLGSSYNLAGWTFKIGVLLGCGVFLGCDSLIAVQPLSA